MEGLEDELREQGRAIVGALLVVGITFVYTMETWWLGWTLRTWHLLVYDVVGLGLVLAVTRAISFREEEGDGGDGDGWKTVRGTLTDFAELLLVSFVTAYVLLLLFGIVDFDEPLIHIARLGLIEIVPLGFGAALANDLLTGEKKRRPRSLLSELGIYVLGALFLSATIAPTQEIERIAAYAGWTRITVLVPMSLLITHLTLYELRLQGEDRRLGLKPIWMRYGRVFLVYGVGFVVAASLLAAFGHFSNQPFSVQVEMTVVLAFPASIGASAADVVI